MPEVVNPVPAILSAIVVATFFTTNVGLFAKVKVGAAVKPTGLNVSVPNPWLEKIVLPSIKTLLFSTTGKPPSWTAPPLTCRVPRPIGPLTSAPPETTELLLTCR